MTTPETPDAPPADPPPWGDDFDPEKAWKKIQNLTDENKKIKARPVLTDEAKARLDEYDEILKASKSDVEKANEQLARWQSRAEKLQSTAVGASIRALASTDFADPSDAVSALDPSKYLGLEDEIDEPAIQKDLAALLEAKPHWKRADNGPTPPRVPAPNAAQGTGGAAPATEPAQQFAAALGQAMQRR